MNVKDEETAFPQHPFRVKLLSQKYAVCSHVSADSAPTRGGIVIPMMYDSAA
jgi:hypothetical protein